MIEFDRLLFGTAGIPLSAVPRQTQAGIAKVKDLGLGAMELEFVRQVNIKEEAAPDVKLASKKYDVILTCHAPYFINLNSLEKEKKEASMQRIIKAATISYLCGAFSMTFHAGYYHEMNQIKVFENIASCLKQVIKNLKDKNIDIWIRPETTGKACQFGTVDEIIKLSQEFEMVMPCIDFSHLYSREAGKINSYDEFSKILEKLENGLGREALDKMHIHLSGIEYTKKGERRHLNLEESDIKIRDIMKVLKDFNAKGTVISESPNIEADSMLMKKMFEEAK